MGVRATPGGRHPAWGTHNALISLGPAIYLEILAPDPGRPVSVVPTVFGLSDLVAPRLVTWAAKADHLERRAAAAAGQGVRLGAVLSGSRQRPDGTLLSWRLTDPEVVWGGGVVPFLIDWGGSAHPAKTAPKGGELLALRAEHPDPLGVESMLRVLNASIPVVEGPQPALIATIETAAGPIELR